MEEVKKNISTILLPGVIGVYFVVHSIYEAVGVAQFSVLEISFDLCIALIYAYVIVFILSRKRSPDSLLIASFVVLFTLFYIPLRDLLFSNQVTISLVREFFWSKYNTFLIVAIIALMLSVVGVFRHRSRRAAVFGKFLVLFFVILTVLDLVMLHRTFPPVKVPISYSPESIHFEGKKPDVYFIIFDAEASSKMLEKYWHHNNDSIEKTFRDKGFFLGKESRSNYNATPYSIASTLNMSYLADNSPIPLTEEFQQNIDAGVVKIFTQNGYAFYNLSYFDINGSPQMQSLLQFSTWEQTLLYFIYDRLSGHSYKSYRARNMELLKGTFDSLSAIIEQKMDRPKFVYAHFFIPHTPAFIEKNGTPREHGSMEPEDMNGYLDQVMYSYTLMHRLFDNIQQSSGNNAIVLFQGDHGYRFLQGEEKWNEQFDIFRAVYFPDKNYAQLTDSTSSVNEFRIVLNSQFGTQLPLIKDTTYNVLINVLKKMP